MEWSKLPRTLKDLEALETDFLTCTQVAPVLGANPSTLRWQAKEAPEKLGFPIIRIKGRVKIPKVAFIKFMRGV